MTPLKKMNHTVGDKRLYTVDYSNTMRSGDWISGATATSNKASATVSTPVLVEPNCVTFFVSGGVIDQDFVITVTVTLNDTEVFHDTIEFHVVDP